MASAERRHIPLEESVIVQPFDFEAYQNSFKLWKTLREGWPKKAALLLKYDELARRPYLENCVKHQDSPPVPVELIYDSLHAYAVEMGKRFLEWLAIDGQPCTKDFVSAVRTDVHAIFNYERRFWMHTLPLRTSTAFRQEYQLRLQQLATAAPRVCLDPLQLEAAKLEARG